MQTTLKRRIIDYSLSALVVIIVLLVFRANLARGEPGVIDKALLRITAPLQAGVSWIVESVGGVWGGYVALIDIEDENRELRAENEKLRRELAAMSRRAFDVEALEDLAVVKRRTPADTLGARVIGAPMNPQFRVMRLRIDRGSKEVQPGMPVITGTGPVGRINKVFGDYADVTLVSDASSSIEVVIPRTGGRGILTGLGRADSYACTIGWLERQTAIASSGSARALRTPEGSAESISQPADSKVQVGDEIVTSGLGASFPPGLVIGTVSVVGKDDGMFQQVEVAPAVDVSRVRAVEVLLAPPPPPDPDAKQKRKSEPAFGGRPL